MAQYHSESDPNDTSFRRQLLAAALRKFNSERAYEWKMRDDILCVPSLGEIARRCTRCPADFFPGFDVVAYRFDESSSNISLIHRHGIRVFIYDLEVTDRGY